MYIIGINAFHPDSSACIIEDGTLLHAVEEERFTRIKHWSGFPINSIKFCLSEANIKLSDIKYIAINRDSKANFHKKILHFLRYRPEIKLLLQRFTFRKKIINIANILRDEFGNDNFNGKIVNVEHHLAHLSSAFNPSPFQTACVLSVDGFGDFASTAWGFAEKDKISVDKKIFFPHSLGIFYESLTQFLGFNNYGDEYKVMGLAPYGKPIYLEKLKQILILKKDGTFELNLDYFTFHKKKQDYNWENNEVKNAYLLSDKINNLLGMPRKKSEAINDFHKDLASSVQTLYEKALFNLLNKIFKKYKNKNLCIAGGCGMNSVANGKITENTPFENIHIHPAAGDAGGAIGAAYYVWNNKLGKKRKFILKHSSWGSSFNNEFIKKEIENHKELFFNNNCDIIFSKDSDLTKIIAKKISEGKVIGWFQGKMEWGSRALGNRSIIADPRNPNMKELLNIKIKKRESFRPFAPSILREHVKNWFEKNDDVQFMMKVFKIKEEKKKLIPAVTHVDGTGRLQTVDSEQNSKYYKLILEFYNLTNIPIILNTSFNENEPIIRTPKEAIDCFLRTKMDILAIENYIIERR
jgi:carbamoyltransferase